MFNEYYVIKMVTSEGLNLYFEEREGKFKWTKYRNNCIWFSTEKDAEDFCKGYFTNYKDWIIEPILGF